MLSALSEDEEGRQTPAIESSFTLEEALATVPRLEIIKAFLSKLNEIRVKDNLKHIQNELIGPLTFQIKG